MSMFVRRKATRYAVVHCTATPAGRDVRMDEVRRWHRARGWVAEGYHFLVHLSGLIEVGRPVWAVGAGVAGHNSNSIHIAYAGGVSADNIHLARDTRTPEQKRALRKLLLELKREYPGIVILGHRDFPGVAKACPSFDARGEYANLGEESEEATQRTHTVKRGDTLWSISRAYGVRIEDIKLGGQTPRADALQVGSVLTIG